jgi:hypothetical protein
MAVAPPLLWAGSIVATWISAVGFVVAAHGLFMGSYTTYGSRIGKLRSREKLLDLAATLRPWIGEEILLDVGCGRGSMLLLVRPDGSRPGTQWGSISGETKI